MNLGVIVESKKISDELKGSLAGDIVFTKLGAFNADKIDDLLVQAARVDLKALIISLEAVDEEEYLAKAIRKYKVIRPHTQIIILAVDRKLGDETILQLVNLAVYDIIAPSTSDLSDDEVIDYAAYINKQLENPATFACAERWRVGEESQDEQKNKTDKGTKTSMKVITKEKIMGSVIIGVTSAKQGSGSTFTTIQIAHYLSQFGNVACIELVDSEISRTAFSSLSEIEGSRAWEYKNVHYYAVENIAEYHKILEDDYIYIVVDFGYVISKNSHSRYLPELIRANIRIIASGPREWDLYYLAKTYEKLLEHSSKWDVLVNLVSDDETTFFKKEFKKSSFNLFCNTFIDNPTDYKSYDTNELLSLLERVIPSHLLNKPKKSMWRKWLK